MNSVRLNILSLNYQKFISLGCKDIWNLPGGDGKIQLKLLLWLCDSLASLVLRVYALKLTKSKIIRIIQIKNSKHCSAQ
jgi:hypothetical protein